ncbi:MAG: hypothetical protein J6F30_00180 [Cellulosilyticum sp.]|nr:hypothetical protein [Cellulosilyticum sp.]
MKYLKVLLGMSILTTSMILVGCGGNAATTNKETASTPVATEETKQETSETAPKKEEKKEEIEVLGLDGERFECDDYSVGLMEGWHLAEEQVVVGFDTILHDDYESAVTIKKGLLWV